MKKRSKRNKPGDMLILINNQGLPTALPRNTLAEVVDGKKRFPKLFEEMVTLVGFKALEDEWICVDWPNNPEAIKGYFSRARFVEIQEKGLGNN